MKIRSNGAQPSAASRGNVSSAGPRRSSTTWARPARAMFARATSACSGSVSSVIRRPSTGSAREPDRAVAAQRADLQDGARPQSEGQQQQQLALVRRNVDRREAGRGTALERPVQDCVAGHEQIGDIAVDRGPLLLLHGSILHHGPVSYPWKMLI